MASDVGAANRAADAQQRLTMLVSEITPEAADCDKYTAALPNAGCGDTYVTVSAALCWAPCMLPP